MANSRVSLLFIFLSTLAATSLAADCFVPNGTDRNDSPDVSPNSVAYVPCNQNNPHSMCCRYGGDDCMPNGLCQGYAKGGEMPVWRESCTDATWTSPYCLKLCIKGNSPDGFDYGGYCCGGNNSSCCGTPEEQYIVDGQVTNIKPNSATSSTSSSSTSSPTAAPISTNPANTPSPQSNNDSGSNVGTIAGGVIGGVVALALLAAAIWFFKGRRKQKAPNVQQQHQAQDAYYPSPAPQYSSQYYVQPGLHEAQAGSDGFHASQLDSQEKHEIAYQKKDRLGRQELE
ncbi:MAG: hypothetical protein Q9226_007378 [Calogaya cf. arnoldii]